MAEAVHAGGEGRRTERGREGGRHGEPPCSQPWRIQKGVGVGAGAEPWWRWRDGRPEVDGGGVGETEICRERRREREREGEREGERER